MGQNQKVNILDYLSRLTAGIYTGELAPVNPIGQPIQTAPTVIVPPANSTPNSAPTDSLKSTAVLVIGAVLLVGMLK